MEELALPQVEDNEHSILIACDARNGGQTQLCDVWRDIQGAHNWNGLLHPIDPILKAEALRYGDLAQLCYDAFDGESYSIHYGTCYYSERDLLKMSKILCQAKNENIHNGSVSTEGDRHKWRQKYLQHSIYSKKITFINCSHIKYSELKLCTHSCSVWDSFRRTGARLTNFLLLWQMLLNFIV